MKIELEVSAEQLKELDKGLNNLLLNLNEEQQVQLIQGYLNKQFQDLYKKDSYWSNTELTDFGKQLIQGLQEQISKSITDKLLEQENVKKEMDEITQKVLDTLPDIIPKAITEYIVGNLFQNRGEINTMINTVYWENKNIERNNNY
jgi:hypothetical protein